MKLILIIISLIIIISCGPESSPEGRMRKKLGDVEKQIDSLQSIQRQIDSLKSDNVALKDSIEKIKDDIQKLKLKD